MSKLEEEETDETDLYKCIRERYDIKCQTRHLNLVGDAVTLRPGDNIDEVETRLKASSAVMLRWMTYNS